VAAVTYAHIKIHSYDEIFYEWYDAHADLVGMTFLFLIIYSRYRIASQQMVLSKLEGVQLMNQV
jgi:hypothetical protein